MGFEVFENYECEGQLSFDDILNLSIPEELIGVSRIFARAKKEMSLAEYKTFIFSLTNFRFKEENKPFVYLDKKQLGEVLGIHSDPDHLSQDIFDNIKELPKHSFIEIVDRDRGIFDSGCIITRVTSLKKQFRIKYDDEYLKLFSSLQDGEYITLWSSDILSMSSARSIDFYEYLRENTDTRETVNRGVVSIKFLKEMFGIPKEGKGSYMREKGGFNRSEFEKKVIEPLFKDLEKCKMIQPVKQANGCYYNKVKQGNRVIGYEFYWTYSAYPRVATATEVKQIQQRVDKNPQVLKVAKDILDGEKKPKKAKKNSFNDFKQRDYDIGELEKQLLTSSHAKYEEAAEESKKPEKPVKVLSVPDGTDKKEKEELENMLNNLAADIGTDQLKALLSILGAATKK